MKNILPTFPKPDTDEHVDEIISSVSEYMGFSSEIPNITSADDFTLNYTQTNISLYTGLMQNIIDVDKVAKNPTKEFVGDYWSDYQDGSYYDVWTNLVTDNLEKMWRNSEELGEQRYGNASNQEIANNIIIAKKRLNAVAEKATEIREKLRDAVDEANTLVKKTMLGIYGMRPKREARYKELLYLSFDLADLIKYQKTHFSKKLDTFIKDMETKQQTKKEVNALNKMYNEKRNNNEESIFQRMPPSIFQRMPAEIRNKVGKFLAPDYEYKGKNANAEKKPSVGDIDEKAKAEKEPSVGPIDENEEADGKPSVGPIGENAKEESEPSIGSIGGKGISKCKKITSKKKYTTRKSPPYSASKCARGTRKKGNDGKLYVVKSTSEGVNRWLPVVSKKVKQTKKYKKSKKYTQKKR